MWLLGRYTETAPFIIPPPRRETRKGTAEHHYAYEHAPNRIHQCDPRPAQLGSLLGSPCSGVPPPQIICTCAYNSTFKWVGSHNYRHRAQRPNDGVVAQDAGAPLLAVGLPCTACDA